VALLCLAGFGFWLLGIPGDSSAPYARPWFIGLMSVLVYPAVIALTLFGPLCTRLITGHSMARGLLIAQWVALLALGIVQAVVWIWMLSVG
jgi:hypothetical protein